MDAEDRVLDHFPHAEAREEAPIYEHGKSSAIQPSYWSVHPDARYDSEELGHGRTEMLAWADAARRLGRLAVGAR
jgi:hypothetical protein